MRVSIVKNLIYKEISWGFFEVPKDIYYFGFATPWFLIYVVRGNYVN